MSESKKDIKYPIEEAIKLVKENAKEKFDASVEVHFRLGIDPKKGDQQVRGSVPLPHGSGKSVRVAVFAEGMDAKEARDAGADVAGLDDLIDEIKTSGKADFDVAVAQPQVMAKLAKIAKILGPRGLMPSPKDDTVTQNVVKAVKDLKGGKVSFKNDDTGNVHTIIGKVSFDVDKLVDNFNELLDTIKKLKPSGAKGVYMKGISVSSSMGKGFKVDF